MISLNFMKKMMSFKLMFYFSRAIIDWYILFKCKVVVSFLTTFKS